VGKCVAEDGTVRVPVYLLDNSGNNVGKSRITSQPSAAEYSASAPQNNPTTESRVSPGFSSSAAAFAFERHHRGETDTQPRHHSRSRILSISVVLGSEIKDQGAPQVLEVFEIVVVAIARHISHQ
jgi:hypothetical protein